MFSWIRRRATYANVAMTLALVFAMTGGAYAAKKYLITSTKQISPSVLKQLVGKAGPAGANGKDGAPGAQGAAGAKGQDGAPGAKGETGATGPKGETGATGPKGETGAKGAAGTNGTNGATGPTGPEGSPWTAGGTLPVGSTETGGWAMGDGKSGLGPSPGVNTAISFTIPLKTALKATNVQSNPVGFPTGATAEQIEHCPGSVVEPKAKSGFLCVYTGVIEHTPFPFPGPGKLGDKKEGADTAGARLFIIAETEAFFASGTWAVTG